MRERGIPWIYIRAWAFGHKLVFKFPPDFWWSRYCRRGDCAYSNYMCPNGCKESVI